MTLALPLVLSDMQIREQDLPFMVALSITAERPSYSLLSNPVYLQHGYRLILQMEELQIVTGLLFPFLCAVSNELAWAPLLCW